ncbi:hypothetical protein LRP30_33945 [Bradyrhizobium sp. C-145]|uniref:hypothetical protein n=1 Tax=Bradyrhizobium sp. C-145 TaxID=574727 RepID=UPI00201B8344|nr:hypothetical protein [Bradyrhizobium sp. C-145]UQR61765.1 hypothetical protein LRP30_33945 [Bradyrhizobium sp. C-145]
MEAVPYKSVVELSTDGPTQVGPFRVCANGLDGGHRRYGSRIKPVPEAERQPVRRDQVEIVKELLRGCRPTRWARNLLSPVSSDLKHWAENWAGPYISTGAAIVAAIELGFVCIPTAEGSRNVFIGVHFDDVAARMAERGWYIARGHEGATRIQPPKPKPEIDHAFWEQWAAENGIKLGEETVAGDGDDDSDPFAVEPPTAPPPDPHPFWARWVEEHGMDANADLVADEVEEG